MNHLYTRVHFCDPRYFSPDKSFRYLTEQTKQSSASIKLLRNFFIFSFSSTSCWQKNNRFPNILRNLYHVSRSIKIEWRSTIAAYSETRNEDEVLLLLLLQEWAQFIYIYLNYPRGISFPIIDKSKLIRIGGPTSTTIVLFLSNRGGRRWWPISFDEHWKSMRGRERERGRRNDKRQRNQKTSKFVEV